MISECLEESSKKYIKSWKIKNKWFTCNRYRKYSIITLYNDSVLKNDLHMLIPEYAKFYDFDKIKQLNGEE
jgi:hypothetical protein